MTAAEYVEYDPATRRYRLPPEHALVIADETSPFFLGGFLELIVPCVSQAPKLLKAFRNGKGVPQRAYPPETFEGIERASAAWYRHKLVQEWLPTMPDVVEKLHAGGAYADVGCGSGRASITVAKAFPAARVFGFDNHAGSIARAPRNARAAGVDRRWPRRRDGGAEGARARREGRIRPLPPAADRGSLLRPVRAQDLAGHRRARGLHPRPRPARRLWRGDVLVCTPLGRPVVRERGPSPFRRRDRDGAPRARRPGRSPAASAPARVAGR